MDSAHERGAAWPGRLLPSRTDARWQTAQMRTYAVRLRAGSYGPEFSSTAEAGAWGRANLPLVDGRLSFEIAYLRDGQEVGHCTSHAFEPGCVWN